MEFSENEIECIKYFPKRNHLLPECLFDYFEMNLCKKTGLTHKQLDDNLREKYRTHNVMKNESVKNIGKDFLVTDSERFMKFTVWFVDDIGYDIYVNKDNCGENRLQFMNCFYYEKIMISDEQTEKLLDTKIFNEIKNCLSLYMNLYRRFEIFWNSVACFLKPVFQEYGYGGYFLRDSKSDIYCADNRGVFIYVYGKETRDAKGFFNLAEKRNILIPFENFAPVLKGMIEEIKKKEGTTA